MQALFNKITSRLVGLTRSLHPLCTSHGPAVLPRMLPTTTSVILNRCFGILATPMNGANVNSLLKPVTPLINPSCGMKVKGKVKLRCKHCYFVWRQETLYVMCKDKPRHKQRQRRVKPHNDYILTHATQGKVRPW